MLLLSVALGGDLFPQVDCCCLITLTVGVGPFSVCRMSKIPGNVANTEALPRTTQNTLCPHNHPTCCLLYTSDAADDRYKV